MSTSFDALMRSLQQTQQSFGEARQRRVEDSAERKRTTIDPNFESFDPDLYDVTDADTLRHRRTGEEIRIQGPKGESLDSFETQESTYLNNPRRAEFHKRAYAQAFGVKREDVTIKDLTELGEIQKERLNNSLETLRGVGLNRTGQDQFGRTLATLDDFGPLEDAKRLGGNASFFAPSNFAGQLRSIASGEFGETIAPQERSLKRALLGDQAVNLIAGASRMANSLLQAGSVLTGTNTEAVTNFFNANKERIQGFKEALSSEDQLFRERMDARRSSLNPELFELRKQKAIDAGKSEKQAAISAGIDEFTDRIGFLIDNPGRILDATIESLPYMIGVGAVGRVAINAAVKRIGENILKRTTAKSVATGVAEAPEILAAQAANITNRFLGSKTGQQTLNRIATNTGTTTVGLTEGLSSSADVYDSIANMTEEEASQSEEYQALRKLGLDHKEATRQLAETAFMDTLATVTLMAGAAGRLTGAAAFESKLFTGLASARKGAKTIVQQVDDVGAAATAVKATAATAVPQKTKVLRTAAKAVATPLVRGVKHISGPGAREAVEETIQSGGGEFLSQLASFDATGEPIGPGVGAATAEGAVVGFASGAGASAVTDSLKAIANAATKPRSNSSGLKERNKVAQSIAEAGTIVPGGSISDINNTQPAPDTDFKKSYNDIIVGIQEETIQPLEAINRLVLFHDLHIAQGNTFTPEEEQLHKKLLGIYKEELANRMNDIRKTPESKWTDLDRAVINAAGVLGIKKKADIEELPESGVEALEISAEINALEKESEQQLAEQVTNANTDTVRQRAIDVHNEKFSDAIGSKGPGLAWYRREMVNTMTDPDIDSRDGKFLALSKDLTNFIDTQVKKLQSNINKKSSPVFIEQLQKELQIMSDTHKALKKQFLVWNPNATSEIVESAKKDDFVPIDVSDIPIPTDVTPSTVSIPSKTPVKAAEKPPVASSSIKSEKIPKIAVKEPVRAPEPSEKQKDTRTVDELRSRAKELGLTGYSALRRTELLQSVVTAEAKSLDSREDAAEVKDDAVAEPIAASETADVVEIADTTIKETKPAVIQTTEEKISNRLAATKSLLRRIKDPDFLIAELKLSNKSDNKFLQDQIESGVSAKEAINAIVNRIEPDPTKRNISFKSTIDKEVLDNAIQIIGLLNAEKSVPAIGISDHWNNFVENTKDSWQWLKGEWIWGTQKPLETDEHFKQIAIEAEKKFAAAKLPTSIADAFARKSQVSNTLFGAIPNLMDVLNDLGAKNKLLQTLQVKPAEEVALNAFISYYNQFKKTLEDNYRELDIKKSFADITLQEHGIHYFENKLGEIDPNVIAAMAFEAMNWATHSGAQTAWNDQEAINSILGRDGDTLITNKEAEILRTAGTVRNNAANEIGQAIWKHLNLEKIVNTDINSLFMDKLIATLGGTALSVLANQNRIELTTVDRKWFQKAREQNPDNHTTVIEGQNTKDKRVNFVRNAQILIDVEQGQVWKDENNSLIVAVREGQSMFTRLFGSDPKVRIPSFTKPTKVPNTISRSVANISSKMKERVLNMSQRAWQVDTSVMSVLARMDQRSYLKMAHKYVDESEIDSKHVTQREGTRGRNAGLDRDFSSAREWNEQYGSRPFYFDYKMIRNGRIHINSNVINPQANKLHRFMFGMKQWEVSVPVNPNTDAGKKIVEDMKIAIALGFDINADKKLRHDVLAEIEVVLQSLEMKDALDVLNKDGTDQYNEDDMAAFAKFLQPSKGKPGGEGTHTLAALVAWNTYNNATEGHVTISLPMETDGITNGFIAGLLQTPTNVIQKSYKNLLRAGGYFFKGDPWKSFPEFIADGGRDNYQQVADSTAKFLRKMSKGILNVSPKKPVDFRDNDIRINSSKIVGSGLLPDITELSLKKGRDWAKNPLMVVAYGASVASVIRAITEAAFEDFHTNLAEAVQSDNPLEAITAAVNAGHDIANVVLAANRKSEISKDKGPLNKKGQPITFSVTTDNVLTLANRKEYGGDLNKFATNFTLSGEILTLFNLGIEKTYGAALGAALEAKLAPIQEIRTQLNHANKLMNIIFVQDFTRRVDTLQKSRGIILGPDDRRVIYADMHNEGLLPSVATAFSEKFSENLETTNFQTEYIPGKDGIGEAKFNSTLDIIDRAFAGEEGKAVTPKGQAAIFTRIISNMPNTDVGVSGVVKLIHALDGVNNSEAWGNNPVLNVHDAQVSKFTDADKIAGDTNADFISMHAGYSLGDAILESTGRMMSLLLAETDSRLSPQFKQKIYNDFIDHLVEFKHYTKKDLKEFDTQSLTEQWFANLQNEILQSNEGRKILFEDGSFINQFAKEGSERSNPEGGPELAQADETLAQLNTLSVNEVLRNFRGELLEGKQIEQDKQQIIADIQEKVISQENPLNIVRTWINHTAPSAERLIDVLQAAYTDTPAGNTLRVLFNILKPHLNGVKVVSQSIPGEKEEGKSAKGKYFLRSRTIVFNEGVTDPNIASTAFHEAIHAANVNRLEELEEQNPDEFEILYNKAINWATNLRKDKDADNVKYRLATQILRYKRNQPKASPVSAVSEYLAYALTTPSLAEDFTIYSDNVVELLGDLFSSLQDPSTGAVKLHSTGESVDRTLFENKFETLEADKMQQIFDQLSKHDQGPVDLGHQQTLNTLLNNFIIPGIESIEDVIQQEIAKDPYATEHIGEIEGGIIRLQAAGNVLSSNVDMSMQETALHEYTHAILRSAIDGNHFVQKEARRLYELAKEGITPDDFLPEKISGSSIIAREKAQARYDHIFDNPNGVQYHEFMAIALTNQAFATALSNLDNKDVVVRIPNWSGGILNQMLELMRTAIQWLSGQSLRTNKGSIHQGVFSLAKATVAINQRNMQRTQDLANGQDQTSKLNRVNDRVTGIINNRIISPLQAGFAASDKKRLDPKNPNIAGFIRSTTHVALASKNSEVRKAYSEVYRSMGGAKDNLLFDLIQEVSPWNQENIGTDAAPGWIDLLRKSKVIVDMARQNITEHTRSFIDKSFDKNNHLTDAHKESITRVMMKTDITSLMENDRLTVGGLQDLLNDPSKIVALQATIEAELRTELSTQNATNLFNVFINQANSLASIMVDGIASVENPLLNAGNIVKQFNLSIRDRVSLNNVDKLTELVDKITTLIALKRTPSNDINLALDMINHEMGRTDVANDNGFSRLLGMQVNFKKLAQERLFENSPVQMIKGYVYEIFDGDINIEIIDDTPEERVRMINENLIEVGPVARDNLDPNKRRRVLYRGLKGLAGYNKSIVSLTDMQHRGANLFSAVQFSTQTALKNLGQVKNDSFRSARNQFQQNYVKPGANMVPVLDDQGNIVDYRYMMSEANKQKILKKKDPFDKVLPRMFASITDRNNTKEINRDVADLLWKEWDKLGPSGDIEVTKGVVIQGEHRFLEISKHSNNAEARDMWNLLPVDMQLELQARFGTEVFYVRDDVANLVLGFRKVSMSNNKMLGRAAPIVKMAEKYWQEIVQLMRIKIAVLTPAVVVGNAASNTAILLSEGIKPSYIRRKGSEAISAMRQFQKDIRARDELLIQIGADEALGKNVRSKINELTRLEAGINTNPVGRLVNEGLFTSIAEDLGADDDSLRGHLINKAVDKAKGIIPDIIVEGAKEWYMLPGTRGYKAAVAATQYGDFVARFIKFNYDTEVRGKDKATAIKESLSAFIYYDIPQNKSLQFLNDNGFLMFTKFFLRIQPIVARVYTQNPVSAFGTLALQKALLADPFNENIMNYGMGSGLTQKPTINPIGKAWDTLNPSEPALLQWILNPFGL